MLYLSDVSAEIKMTFYQIQYSAGVGTVKRFSHIYIYVLIYIYKCIVFSDIKDMQHLDSSVLVFPALSAGTS